MSKISTIMRMRSAEDKRVFACHTGPDPFGREAERTRQEAALQAEMEEWMAADEAEDEDERRYAGEFYLSYNEGRILFALVALAGDPHLTQTPAITVKQWAHHFNIRPTQVTSAFRHLHRLGIPKPPAPIPLDGLLRFLADQVKAVAESGAGDDGHGVPQSLLNFSAGDWIVEYFETHIGGVV